jgi:hypothetical protein
MPENAFRQKSRGINQLENRARRVRVRRTLAEPGPVAKLVADGPPTFARACEHDASYGWQATRRLSTVARLVGRSAKREGGSAKVDVIRL